MPKHRHAAYDRLRRASSPGVRRNLRRGSFEVVRADLLRQCMHMIQQENGFVWPLVSETAGARLRWHRLGSATWLDGVASFPRGPDEPGVYLVKLTARGKYRIYIGEAANLRKRLRSYGGHGAERPIERGKTTTNMRGRVRRVLRENDGSVEVYLLELPIDSGHTLCENYPACKDCRIMLERVALSTAYLRHEPLINEHGFPKASPEDPLQ
jgi:hypothetical protein